MKHFPNESIFRTIFAVWCTTSYHSHKRLLYFPNNIPLNYTYTHICIYTNLEEMGGGDEVNNNNNNTIIHHYGGRDGKRIELNKFHIVHPLCRKISLFKLFSLLSHHIENPFLLHMYISHHSHSIKSLIFTAEAASTRMSKRKKKWGVGGLRKDGGWETRSFCCYFSDGHRSEWVSEKGK